MKTPLYKLYNEQNNVYIKRDDLLPFCFGGNKYRIALRFFEDMRKKGANHLIAYGPPSSNLCRVLANMAKSQDIKYSVICPSLDKQAKFYNSIMLKGLGAEQIFCSKSNVAETVERTLENSKKNGYIPYYIYGDKYGQGNEKTPVFAYYDVYKEIIEQEKELGVHFDYIYIACGTGMTYSGLLCGSLENDLAHNIVGISVARRYKDGINYIQKYIEAFMGKPANISTINLVDKYRLQYGEYNEDILHTIKHVFQKYGVPLDPIYTGKAFWAMQEELKNMSGKNVLFIHTGGTPIFFDFVKNIMEEI